MSHDDVQEQSHVAIEVDSECNQMRDDSAPQAIPAKKPDEFSRLDLQFEIPGFDGYVRSSKRRLRALVRSLCLMRVAYDAQRGCCQGPGISVLLDNLSKTTASARALEKDLDMMLDQIKREPFLPNIFQDDAHDFPPNKPSLPSETTGLDHPGRSLPSGSQSLEEKITLDSLDEKRPR